MIELGVSAGIDLAGYRRIVAGEALVPAESAYERVAAARASFERHLARGGSAYGVTTGLGYLTSAAVGDADQAALQRSLVTARASGLGAPLPAEVVRGAMTLRLNGFLSGHAVVTPDLCRFIAARINEGWAPVVPAGPYGAAGEIGPLAHLFQTLIGEGLVTEGDEIVPAGEALARAGVAPYELQPKEGLALIDGSPFATALAVHVVDRGARLLRQAGRAAALSIAVTGASTRSLSPRVTSLWRDPPAARVAAELLELLAGAPLWENRSQAPVSMRVVPQVHGALLGRLEELERNAEQRLDAVTGSPLFFDAAADEPEGLYPSGAFHAAATTLLLESVGIAIAHVTNLVEKRLHRLLDSRFSGLPEQLARVPGRQAGAVSLHKAVVALAMDNRLLSTPASVHVTDTSTGQEDVQALTFLVAERLDRSLSNLETALACELTALRHAAALRPEPIAAPALAATLSSLADLVPPLEEDRMLSPEVERVRALLQGGALAGP
jgi:histidine ammonia-lyase